MLSLPAARHGAGSVSSSRSIAVAAAAFIVVGLSLSTRATAQQGSDIIKRMQTLYKNAQTYEGTVVGSQSGKTPDGKPYTLAQTQVVKFKKPSQFYLHISAVATGAAAQANGANQTIVSDGTTLYKFDGVRKLYVKQKAPAGMPPLGAAQIAAISFDLPSAKVISTSSVDGHSAYIVQVMPDLSRVPAAQRAKIISQIKPYQLTIDKSNYYLLRLAPPGTKNVVNLTSQTVNKPISSSVFAFVPPPGSKLYTPPPTAPGAPGAPTAPGAPH